MPENYSLKKECVLCGRCLEVCPIFRVTDKEELSPRGKGFLLGHYLEQGIKLKSAIDLAGFCVGCNRCFKTCPQKINLPLEIARLKSLHPDWKSWIWSRIVKSGTGLLPAIKSGKAIIPGTAPVLKQVLLNKPRLQPLLKAMRKKQLKKHRAVVFPGCVGQHFRPELEKTAFQLLNLLGYEALETPDWQCCGYPLGSAGLLEQEKKDTMKNLDLWLQMDKPMIFVFCATCEEGLRNPFGEYQSHYPWKLFRQSVHPLIEQLAFLEFEPAAIHEKRKIVWHQPCHGSVDSGLIFQNILNSLNRELTILNNNCCGMGGSFAIQNPKLSSSIAEEFWKGIPQTKSTVILTGCSGCVLQLEATKPDFARVAHWLEFISTGD